MPVLPLFAINALIMMAAAAGGLWPAMAPDWPRPALTHVALGLGILPLILAAMSHFVPVLTRSRATLPHTLSLVPLLAWLAAVLLIGSLSGDLPGPAPRHLAFLLAFSATAALLVWIELRRRHTVGQPHPGLYWYVAALLCLGLALLAVPLMNVWPAHYRALRLLHLHLNLLGFVGLTALGTLQVLLPTTLTQPDPQAAQRLRPGADLKFALAGTLLIALGAAIAPLLSLPGVALYLIPAHAAALATPLRPASVVWLCGGHHADSGCPGPDRSAAAGLWPRRRPARRRPAPAGLPAGLFATTGKRHRQPAATRLAAPRPATCLA